MNDVFPDCIFSVHILQYTFRERVMNLEYDTYFLIDIDFTFSRWCREKRSVSAGIVRVNV